MEMVVVCYPAVPFMLQVCLQGKVMVAQEATHPLRLCLSPYCYAVRGKLGHFTIEFTDLLLEWLDLVLSSVNGRPS